MTLRLQQSLDYFEIDNSMLNDQNVNVKQKQKLFIDLDNCIALTRHLLNIYWASIMWLGTILSTGDAAVNKKSKNALMELQICWKEDIWYQRNIKYGRVREF